MAQPHPYDENKARQYQNLLGQSNNTPPPVSSPTEKPPESGTPLSPSTEVPSETGTPSLPAEDETREKKAFFSGEKFLRALWTIASIISMTVTIVVLIVALVAFRYINKYAKYFPVEETLALLQEKGEALPPDLTIEQVGAITTKTVENFPDEVGVNTPLDLLQGLYDNFEKMDQAHIKTNILVEDEIPVAFTLGLNQNTTVVLSEAVTIDGARVALTTGGLNIFNAPATVVLPAGTELPIRLSLEVPVNEMIPIALNVPVDIALAETDLHEPFVGLQDVVRPLYCLVKLDATNSFGVELCPVETPLEE